MSYTATQTIPHHHRSTTKTSQKAFKSRHATKSDLKEKQKGKIDSASIWAEKGARRTPHQHVMSRLDRKNHAKQIRQNKDALHAKAASVFSGRDAAPRLIAVVPLCRNVELRKVVEALSKSVEIDEEAESAAGVARIYVERFKQTLACILVQRDLFAVLDACRMADFVLFVISAEEEVDELGELFLKTIENQGVSNTLVVAQGVDNIEPAKKRPQVVASLKSYVTHFFPSTDKVNSLDSRQECLNVVRSLCTTTPKGIRWREDRSWMMVEDVKWPGSKAAASGEQEVGEVVLSGVVRGKGLKADRLLQIGDWGYFQIEKIVAASLESARKKTKSGHMAIDSEGQGSLLEESSEGRDDLADLAPEDVLMDEMDDLAMSVAPSERKGVLVDDHHYFSDEETRVPEALPRKLPRGTSKYQAAWFLDTMSDSGSDMESVDERMFDNDDAADEDGAMGNNGDDINMGEATEGGPSEYPQSEAFLDPAPEDEAEAIEEYRKSRRNEADEDLEFPDEIELHPNVSAKDRLARYRGLKSLRTSPWETEEDRAHEPSEWRRLLEISNYKGAKNRVLNESLVGGVKPGTRVSIHICNVPTKFQEQDINTRPLAAYSLLRHEQKRAAINYSITLNSEVEEPIRSKSELIVQCGPRRFVVNPLFSQAGTTPNDVHKFHRYLHAGRTAIATFIGPLTWGSIPLLYFQRDPSNPTNLIFVGTGTSLPPSQSRVVAKRIVLAGSPFKINKRVVTVRYMFFNAEDIAWFKALTLWTKRGRTGFIKESLGTHGYFKAQFDGKINPMDSVALSMYKRVFPKSGRLWHGEWEDEWHGLGENDVEGDQVPELVMS